MDLQGKVAIVTGGASGLGEATVDAYVAKGMTVAIFDLNAERAQAVIDRHGAENVSFYSVNVADEASVKEAVAGVVTTHGGVHVCNNYAGIGSANRTYGRSGVFPLDNYMQVVMVNQVGTFNVSRFAAEAMSTNEPVTADGGRGVIINTASIAAYEGQIGQLAYSATKGAVVGMTLPMARDLVPYGIRVNTIVPGLINTPLFNGLTPEFVESLSQSVLYPKRLGRPEEIAQLAAAIIDNDYINGECIRMDGGIRMQPR